MSHRTTTRARLLSGGAIGVLAALAFAGAANAQAAPQDEDATQVDEIIVTGIRASIQNSIAAKARNTSIVEVITAEDIGKLPDVSIAESLARLPGLTVQRLDGRGQLISLRGLGPDYTTALLNGREQVTTGDNRGVEFDQYPSELLGGVTVYKTPDAQLIGQGLAGTVDLQTVRPLAFGQRAIAANVRYELNDIGALNAGSTDEGVRYSVSYIDQFLDGTLGIALGYAHIQSPYQSERFNAWGYPATGSGALVIGGVKPYVMSSELERDGFMGTVEFRPNDRFHTTVDAFYSEFQNTQILRGIEFPLFWGGSSESVAGACTASGNTQTATCRPGPVLSGATVEDGFVTSGTFSNVKGVLRNDVNTRDSEIFSIGWNTVVGLTDNWSLMADLNMSRVERTDVVLETYSGTGRNVAGALDTLGFTIDDGVPTFTSVLNYADPNLIRLTSPQGWGGDVIPGGQDGYLNNPTVEDEINAVRVESRYDFTEGPFTRLTVGVNISEREKTFVNDQFFLGVPGGASAVVPQAFLLPATQLTYLGLGGVLSYDALGLVNSGFYNQVRNPNADVLSGNWSVTEKVDTGYVQLGFDHNLWSMPFTGNFGVQYVRTDQSSEGFASRQTGTAQSLTVPETGGLEFDEILPAVNMILEVAPDHYLRAAVARTLARPRMDDMRASRNVSYDVGRAGSTDINNSPWGGGGGNPELRPTTANVFDLSYEWYFANRTGYLSLAAFYKDLETFVFTRNQLVDFTGYPIGPITPTNPEPVLRQGIISAPDNGEGGYIQGLEFAVSAPFEIIHPALEGFGAQFSISYTESEIEPDGVNPTPLPGLSETVANLTVYYEKNGWQLRASNRYRDDFLGEVAGFGNGRTLRSVAAENIVDAQIGYEFQSGILEGASVLFQVNNLTDEPFKTFENGDERRTIDFQRYGRTYLFGINYRY